MQIKIKLLKLSLFFGLLLLSFHTATAQIDGDYYLAAVAEGKKGNFTKAAELCKKGLQNNPADIDLKEYLGKCYLELKQLDQARITLLDVLRKSPDREDARHYLINVEASSKRYASAICFVNELLEKNPYDKSLWLRKIGFYKQLYNDVEAERAITRLLQIYPNDESVRKTYTNLIKEKATNSAKKENLEEAVTQYEIALTNTKKDPEMYLGLINTQIKLGQYDAALATTNKGLNYLTNNEELFLKKIALLEEKSDYSLAINLLQQKLKKSNNTKYTQLLNHLISESAANQMNNDPYTLYGKLYAQNPGNKEAFDYLLKTSLQRSQYDEAQEFITTGLKSNPNSKDLLVKQLTIYERTQNHEKIGTTTEKLARLFPNDSDINEKYTNLKYNQAKKDLENNDYSAALEALNIAASHPDLKLDAKRKMFTIYKAQKDYDAALKSIDELISQSTADEKYVLDKISLFAEMGKVEQAYALALASSVKEPSNKKYSNSVEEIAYSYIKQLNNQEKHAQVESIAANLIAIDPTNNQAYLYAIGAQLAQRKFQEALTLTREAITMNPDSKPLRLKLAGINSALKNHEEAAQVLRQLRTDYPYNDTIQSAYLETMYLYAKALQLSKDVQQERQVYENILTEKESEIPAALKLSALLLQENNAQQAMAVIDKSIASNSINADLLAQKALILEKQGNFSEAIAVMQQFEPSSEKMDGYKEHLTYLQSKLAKNQFGLSYVNVKTDSIPLNTSVASLEYTYFANKNNAFLARVNYAGKNTGVGVQGELEWNHTLKNPSKSSFSLSAGVSNKYFQKLKTAVSYFQPLKNEWQVEIGARYAQLSNNTNFYTGILGVEKMTKNIWWNVKTFIMKDPNETYYNILGQTRFYMSNEQDYIVAMAGVGNAPEDERLDFQLSSFLSYTNTMVGGGYFHNFNYRHKLGLLGNWYNYKMTESSHINQFNVSLSFSTKF